MKKRIWIALLLTAALLCGCGAGNGGQNADGAGGTQTAGGMEEFTVTPMASGLELTPVSTVNMRMDIPQGWVLEEADMAAGMYHCFRAYDPECAVNQIFFILKAEPLFASEFLRENFSYYNSAFASFPVVTEGSVAGYFAVLPQYLTAASAESFYGGVHFPLYEDFTVTEQFDTEGGMGTSAVLRAEFTQDGVEAEGLFAADMVLFDPMPALGGYYMVYCTTILSAEKGTFQNWEDILGRSLATLDYTSEFTSVAMSQSDAKVTQSQQLSRAASEMSDSIMSSWESRNKSQDIISQKQSDATMGFERVMDTETGEIYQTDSGFTDWYDGQRYKAVTDDQYTEAVVGRFSWK